MMASCKACMHNVICDNMGCFDPTGNCTYFQDRSRFVELPDVGDYDTVTTIDEAIDHCYQIATSTDENVCAECKAEHMRLCGWLGDLKRRIAAEQALKERE